MNHQGPQIPEDVNDSNLYRAYRLLLSVCETGVLSRACDRTGLSLPTASRLLARARTWFDDPLFVHSAGRMYPTVRMKALRPRLIEAMRATDALFNEENVFDPQSAEGVVRIVAIDNAFYTLLIPLIMELRKEAPGIRFRVYDRFPEMMSVLRHGDLDLAVYSTLGKACPPDFHEQTLFESGHVLLVRRGHPLSALAKKRPLRLEDVAKYEHVGVAITMSTDGPRLIIGQQAMNVHDRLCCEMPFIVAGPGHAHAQGNGRSSCEGPAARRSPFGGGREPSLASRPLLARMLDEQSAAHLGEGQAGRQGPRDLRRGGEGAAVLSFEHFRHEKASRRREAFSCVWAGVSMSFGRRRPSAA